MDYYYYTGEIRVFAYPNLVPKGWLICDGKLLSINAYSQLFSILGIQFGGDGKTTFALPNLVGKVAIGMGKTAEGKTYKAGESGGDINVTLTASNLPTHTHALQGAAAGGTEGGPEGNLFAQPVAPQLPAYRPETTGVALVEMEPGMINAAGANRPFSKVQPVMGVLFAIATEGVTPKKPK